MAGPAETSRQALTGDDIVSELLRTFEAGLFKIRYTTLAPCRYNVYLSQADYDALPVFGILAQEGKRALSEALEAHSLARISYQDEGGSKEYAMTKDAIVIGRGGKSFFKIQAKPDVPREHCRIRRDAASGRFYLKDVCRFGTTLDGQPVPGSIEPHGDKSVHKNVEAALPPHARIGLADVVMLDFEAVAQP